MLLILCDTDNMLRTAHYRMYFKYLIGSRNVKKNCENLKKSNVENKI